MRVPRPTWHGVVQRLRPRAPSACQCGAQAPPGHRARRREAVTVRRRPGPHRAGLLRNGRRGGGERLGAARPGAGARRAGPPARVPAPRRPRCARSVRCPGRMLLSGSWWMSFPRSGAKKTAARPAHLQLRDAQARLDRQRRALDKFCAVELPALRSALERAQAEPVAAENRKGELQTDMQESKAEEARVVELFKEAGAADDCVAVAPGASRRGASALGMDQLPTWGPPPRPPSPRWPLWWEGPTTATSASQCVAGDRPPPEGDNGLSTMGPRGRRSGGPPGRAHGPTPADTGPRGGGAGDLGDERASRSPRRDVSAALDSLGR